MECQVSLAQLFIKGILHQNILESQLLAGQCIDMRSVRTAGQMLGTIIETVILIEFKITSGQRVTPRHIDISGILGLGTVLPERIGFSLQWQNGNALRRTAHDIPDCSLFGLITRSRPAPEA